MPSLIITIAELKFADSLMPITRIVVISKTTSIATRLKNPVTCGRPASLTPGGNDITGHPHALVFHQRVAGSRRQLRRNHNANLLQQAVEVPRPARRHRRRAKRVLQHQVPPDDPCHQLAQRRVAIRVRRTRNRNDRSKLRIAQSGKRARMPASTKLSATAGPACRAAACPVSTNIPAPITAPMPSVIRFTAPSDRFSVCSPCSPASCDSIDMGLIRSSLDMERGTTSSTVS